MKNLISLFVLVLFGSFVMESAEAQFRRRPDQPSRPQPRPPAYDHQDRAEAYIGRSFYGRSYINIGQELRGPNRYSRSVREIVLMAHSQRFRGQAQLLNQRRPISYAVPIGRQQRHVFAVNGADLNSLELQLDGEIFVDRIVVHFEQRYNPPPHRPPPHRPPMQNQIMERVRIRTLGHHSIALSDILQLHRFQGREVASVILRGRALQRDVMAQAIIGQYGPGGDRTASWAQPIGAYRSEIRLQIHGFAVVGQNFHSLRVQISGDAEIDEIGIEFR